MKLAIQHRKGSFSDRWIKYCKDKNIAYILVNVFDNDIIEQLIKQEVTHFMWHINHASSKDLMISNYVMNSIESVGIKCFPNFNTRWHFDDKIAQKYFLESIGAPMAPSFVFYDREEALNHIENVTFPIVFKLKRGAGSSNVKLLRSQSEAEYYINKMFTGGINPNSGAFKMLDQKILLVKRIKSISQLINKTISYIKRINKEFKISPNEKNYFFYQRFIPGNNFDIRVIVIDGKAFAIKRLNRKNDFRASGSGHIIYDKDQIDKICLEISFKINERYNLQCIAYDYIFDENNNPLIVEICFGFAVNAYDLCPGYWTSDLKWHEQKFIPQFWMVEELIKK